MGLRGATVVVFFSVLATTPLIAQVPTGADATNLATALQRRYDTVRDFSADFEHRYRGGVLKRETVERGIVLIKKPGKMRWEYTAPERKLFVSNGARMYFYVPADKQVTVSDVPEESAAPTPALFLAGRGNLLRDFKVSFADVPEGFLSGSRALKLEPVSTQNDYEWLVLVVDQTSLLLRGLVAVDAQGGTSTFTFTGLEENIGPADARFEFEVPRGVDVVTAN
jgi:outer membrane lipoprotein carrier protein